MKLLDELKLTENKLRGIRADPNDARKLATHRQLAKARETRQKPQKETKDD